MLVGVQLPPHHAVVVELWLPSVPFQREHMPDLLGPVGQRYAFVSDLAAARALITPDLVDAAEEIGGDVTVVWLEDDWVLAQRRPTPARPASSGCCATSARSPTWSTRSTRTAR